MLLGYVLAYVQARRKDNKDRGLDADREGTADFVDTGKIQFLSSVEVKIQF